MVTADSNRDGGCRIRIHRGPGAPAPLPFNCVNVPPCHGGRFTRFETSPEACANIFYGGAIRASWEPEGEQQPIAEAPTPATP
jgi:hypothetical protein